MAIRVFINQWTEFPSGGLVHIKDPIDAYLADVSLSAPVVGQNFHANISPGTKRPDRAYLVKVMRGDLAAAEWDMLAGLPDVRMVPPKVLGTLVSALNTPARNAIYAVIDPLGIPRTTLTAAATLGDFLHNVLAELGSGYASFGTWELLDAEWA